MKIMKIDTDCTDNGNGIRTVIYVPGCNFVKVITTHLLGMSAME